MTNYEYPPLGGGAGRMTQGLATRLVRAGDRVDLVTMGAAGLNPEEEQDGVRIVRVPTHRREASACTVPEAGAYLARAATRVARMLRDRPYDVVHSHFVFPDGLLASWATRSGTTPYVLTAHGTDVPGHNPHRVRTLHTLLGPVWRRVTSGAKSVVCPSEALAARVTRANAHSAVTVIPNAFEAERFSPRAERGERILVVSRMVPLKGLQYLIEALALRGHRGEVVFVGDGPEAPRLRRLAQRLGVKITFTGWLPHESPELKHLYETSGFFVFPSEAENCPLVLLEAMAAGLPIVTTLDEGCRSLVGDAALLVPPRNAPAIARALDELEGAPNQCDRMARTGRQRVVEHFGWDRLIERHRELYARHAA